MGLDFGSKTVGVAVSDPLFITAQPVEIVRRESEGKLRKTYQRLEELIKEYEVGQIVCGLPKLLNNDESTRVEKTREFADKLKARTGLEIVFWDERLTTVQSNNILMESNVRREDRYKYVDMLAAQLILQSYLDNRKSN